MTNRPYKVQCLPYRVIAVGTIEKARETAREMVKFPLSKGTANIYFDEYGRGCGYLKPVEVLRD